MFDTDVMKPSSHHYSQCFRLYDWNTHHRQTERGRSKVLLEPGERGPDHWHALVHGAVHTAICGSRSSLIACHSLKGFTRWLTWTQEKVNIRETVSHVYVCARPGLCRNARHCENSAAHQLIIRFKERLRRCNKLMRRTPYTDGIIWMSLSYLLWL